MTSYVLHSLSIFVLRRIKINLFLFTFAQTLDVETYATRIFMSRAILENIIPAFISFFIGPWSDKYGRKPILLSTFLGKCTVHTCTLYTGRNKSHNPSLIALFPFSGYFLVYFSIAMISFLSSYRAVSPWYYLLAFIPISVLGGTCALITSIFCYITDVSTQENRAFR